MVAIFKNSILIYEGFLCTFLSTFLIFPCLNYGLSSAVKWNLLAVLRFPDGSWLHSQLPALATAMWASGEWVNRRNLPPLLSISAILSKNKAWAQMSRKGESRYIFLDRKNTCTKLFMHFFKRINELVFRMTVRVKAAKAVQVGYILSN